jgi:hypothetical protein
MTMRPGATKPPSSFLPDSLSGFAAVVCALALVGAFAVNAVVVGPVLMRKSRAEARRQQLEQQMRGAAAPVDAQRTRSVVDAQLERLRASVPVERRDLELIDELRGVARRSGAVGVLIAPPGGVQVAAPTASQPLGRETLLKRDPSQLRTDLVTFSAEGRYPELVAFLRELAREPRLSSVESISLSRRPPRIAWTLTLKAARW